MKLLRPAAVEVASPTGPVAERRFTQSMLVSGTRCLFAYILFPYVLPLLGWSDLLGPALGLFIGVVAVWFNVRSIRRLRRENHRLKWPVGLVNLAVIGLMCKMAVDDILELAG